MKTKSTFFTGATGSFEQVTLKKWKRFRILSGKSIGNLTNIAPRIIGQRIAMSKLGELATNAGSTIALGLAEFKLKRSWWPMFMSLNLGPAFDFTDPEAPVFLPAGLTVAKGSLGITVPAIEAHSATGGSIDYTWPTLLSGFQSDNDRMRWIVLNRTKGLYYSPDTLIPRSNGEVEMSGPPLSLETGDILDIWTFFINPNGSGVVRSGNSYYTEVTVAA
jgi:hypothetical protein